MIPAVVKAQEAGFTLPKLPYAFDALEPHIDAKTMEIHWGRHHKAYVDKTNGMLAEKGLEGAKAGETKEGAGKE